MFLYVNFPCNDAAFAHLDPVFNKHVPPGKAAVFCVGGGANITSQGMAVMPPESSLLPINRRRRYPFIDLLRQLQINRTAG